jgi:hypothetical protein
MHRDPEMLAMLRVWAALLLPVKNLPIAIAGHTLNLSFAVWVSPLLVEELRRLVQESEIMKEDDGKWPKKNIVGRQELEVRLGNEHISFEVRASRACVKCAG